MKTKQILYLHCPDRGTPFAETLSALNTAHQAGKFVQLGLSNFTAAEVAEVVLTCKYNGWVRPTYRLHSPQDSGLFLPRLVLPSASSLSSE